jgi:hypothetical protein
MLYIHLQQAVGYVVLNAFSVQETTNKLLKAADTGNNSFQNGRVKQEEVGEKKTRGKGERSKRKNNHKTFSPFHLREDRSFTIKSQLANFGTSKKET